MPITLKPGDYIHLEGLTPNQCQAAADAFITAGAAKGSGYPHNRTRDWRYMFWSTLHGGTDRCDNAPSDGRHLTLNDVLSATNTQPEWNGEGLPPVGTVCQFLYYDNDACQGTIVTYHDNRVWIDAGDQGDFICAVDEVRLCPLKSEEDVAVEEMTRFVAGTGVGDNRNTRAAMQKLYQAGYRKVETD